MDATEAPQTEIEPTSTTGQVSERTITIQCSINLTDILGQLVDGKLILPASKNTIGATSHSGAKALRFETKICHIY